VRPGLGFWTDEIEGVQAEHRERIAALYRGEALDQVPAIAGPFLGASHGLWGTNDIDMLVEPERWLEDVLADMARQAHVLRERVTFCPAMVEMDALGVRYIDALFGAPVRFYERQVWSEGLPCAVAELARPEVASHPVFLQSIRLARLAVEAGQGRLLLANPVLSCAANIGMNLFGGRLLEATILEPDDAARALGTINEVICQCTQAFVEAIPPALRRNSVGESRYAPPGFGQIDGCATQLLSAEVYRDFFAPLDAAVLRLSPHGGMIHLCGAHAQHIPVWREMPELRSVQVNDRAAEDLELYFRGLRDDQVIYVGPTETMSVDRILAITEGRRVVLQCYLAEPLRV
jgi:hypothetical protein